MAMNTWPNGADESESTHGIKGGSCLHARLGNGSGGSAPPFSGHIHWQANWIWNAWHIHTPNTHLFLRKRFRIPHLSEVAEIRAHCATPGDYRLWINGRFIGRGAMPAHVQALSADSRIWKADSLADLFREENVVSVIAYNLGVGTLTRPPAQAGFLFQLELLYRDGHTEIVPSDATWRVASQGCWKQNSTQMFWATGWQEVADLSLWDDRFFHVGYNDTPWSERTGDDANTDPTAFAAFMWEDAVEFGIPPVAPWQDPQPRTLPYLLEVIHRPVAVVDAGWCVQSRPAAEGTAATGSVMTNAAETDSTDFQEAKDNPAAVGTTLRQRPLPVGANMAEVTAAETHCSDRHAGLSIPAADEPLSVPAMELHPFKPDGAARYIVYDFGGEQVGYPVFDFEASGTGVLDIAYSECLTPEGRVDPTRQGILQADRLLLAPGRFRWEMFGRRAFRYLQLTFRDTDAPLMLYGLHVRHLRFPFARQGTFRCSDPSLDAIMDTSRRTLDISVKEHYEDCPLRERALYLGDLRVMGLMTHYAFGDGRVIARGLRLYAQDQRPDGWFRTVCPGGTRHNIVDYLPHWIVTLREYVQHTGDLALAGELFDCMDRLLGWFGRQTDADGLLPKRPDWWIFLDWSDIEKKGIVTGLQCLYAYGLNAAAELADMLGRKEYAIGWNRRAAQVKTAVRTRMWNESEGAFADCLPDATTGLPGTRCSVQTQCLAIVCGMADDHQTDRIRERLAACTDTGIQTGYFKLYELEAYDRLGLHERFLSEFGYWREMLARGATTWWEVFDRNGSGTPNTSLCHGWSSAPLYLLPAKVLGISPETQGFGIVRLRPRLHGLEWAEGSVPTVHGDVRIRLEQVEAGVRMQYALPDGVEAWLEDGTGMRLHGQGEAMLGSAFR